MKRLISVKDLTGQKFGKLTVIGIDNDAKRKTYWYCECDCGNIKRVRSDSLQAGNIKSCGCLKKAQDDINLSKGSGRRIKNERGYQSGKTRLYHIWCGIKSRCYNENDARFMRYGGRGIELCEEWQDFGNFHDWALKSGYSDNLTIDRIDNDGKYEPSNCKWSTQKEQSRNRSTNIDIKIGNSTKTLTEWCEIFELEYSTVIARYHRKDQITLDELFQS